MSKEDKLIPVPISKRTEPYWKHLNRIIDPEVGIGIVDLGLIYDVDINKDGHCAITMTLTSPTCPMGQYLLQQVQTKMLNCEGVRDVYVDLVWDPVWTSEMIDPDVRDLMFGF